MSALTTSAVLLRAYPYSETSQILRFFTESHGVVGAMARGVRKSGGKRGGSLSTFSEGILTVHFRENRDLQTFRDFSQTNARMGLASDPLRLAAASVLGELILQQAQSEGNPGLYVELRAGLDAMETAEQSSLLSTLLLHLWSVIRVLGFGPMIQECVECGDDLLDHDMGRFDFGAGGLRCPSCQREGQGPRLGPVARSQLRGLLGGEPPDELMRPRAHLRLASDFITYHISGGTPLRSMAVLTSLFAEADA